MADRAKLFKTGGSQAVRLPRRYRFPGQTEVLIRREGKRIVLEDARRSFSRRFLSLAGWPARGFPLSGRAAGRAGTEARVRHAPPSRHERLRRLPDWSLSESGRPHPALPLRKTCVCSSPCAGRGTPLRSRPQRSSKDWNHARVDALVKEIECLDFDLRAAASYGRVRALLEAGGRPIGPERHAHRRPRALPRADGRHRQRR